MQTAPRTITAILPNREPSADSAPRVRYAPYCRVSSDSSDQELSFAAQVKYYTEMVGKMENAELVDVYATVMDLAGVAPDHTQFGRSLRASLADPAAPLRPYACCEGGRLAGEIHCDESHAGGPNGVQPANEYYPRLKAQEDDVAHGKATMLRTERYKYVRRLYEEDQLFDLAADPHETVDRIHDPALAGVLAELRLAMLDWYQATCDAVPFTYDGRFTGEMIWAKVKRFCPPEQKARVLAMAGDNIPMARILAWADRLARGGDPAQYP